MDRSKICVLTGATSGIGWEVAHQMAKKGYVLKVVGRSEKKGEALRKSLKRMHGEVDFEYFVADLSTIKNIKEVAAKINSSVDHIDALINNAGGVFSNFELTEDGIEKTMANNHLSYFVLTHQLLDKLKAADEARLLLVASKSHFRVGLDFETFTQKKKYNIMKAYAQSKLANVMFGYKLTRYLKDTNVSTFIIHPGVVRTPIGSKSDHWLHRTVWSLFAKFMYNTTPEESAKNYVYLATEKESRAHNGFYFSAGLIEKSSDLSYDEKLQDKLWSWSEEVSGVKYE
ncbi:MAG: SDR family NAD(P)-dependent oxidoreductase [Chitinophagales bacterium]